MASNNCSIIPAVSNSEGISVDSKLFTDLLSYTNNDRTEAKRIYIASKTPDTNDYNLDENGELGIEEAIKKYNTIFNNETADPVKEFIIKNKIKTHGRDLFKSYSDLRKLRSQFPDYVFTAVQSSGGYSIDYYKNEAKQKEINEENKVDFDISKYNNKNAKQVLEILLNEATDKNIISLAKLLLDNVDKINFVDVKVGLIDKRAAGQYSSHTGLIELSDGYFPGKETWERVILHELVHAYTMSAIINPKTEAEIEFKKQITKIYDSVKNSSMINNYGLTDIFEFMAEILSNPKFVNELAKSRPTLFTKIINALRKLLGLSSLDIEGKYSYNEDEVKGIQQYIFDFIKVSSPEMVPFYPNVAYSKINKKSVIGEIDSYLKQTNKDRNYVSELEKAILTIHKRIKYIIGKTNLEIKKIQKNIKTIEKEYNVLIRDIVTDYVNSRGGIYDKGYEQSQVYKDLIKKLDNLITPLENDIEELENYKLMLNEDLVDISIESDIRPFELQYANLASEQMNEIDNKTYDLNNPQDIEELSNDYNFLHLFSKFNGMYHIKGKADILINKLINNFISPFISQTATNNLNLSGLDETVLDIDNLLKNNSDVTLLEKYFRGLGDYPRLEAQLIHSLTVEGSKRARSNSEKFGEEILNHQKKLIKWAKNNKLTNMFGLVNLTKVYELLSDVNHLDRLDLVKPYTNEYYRLVNHYIKQRYSITATPVEIGEAKTWLKNNYYSTNKESKFVNPKFQYIKDNQELHDFYIYFQEKVSETYDKLPEFVGLKNKEKIPTLVKEMIFEWYGLSPLNIMKSIKLGVKTILFGSGTPVFYNEDGELTDKFTIKELTQDQVRLKMIGEVESKKKSNDLSEILFNFYSFGNEYEQMSKVLPIVKLVQNIVAKKNYGQQGISGDKSRINSAFELYIDKTITKTETQDQVEFKLLGTKLYDNEGNEVGENKFYWSTLVGHLLKYTRVLQLGLNVLSAVGNLAAGISSNVTEAFGGRYYGIKDYVKGLSIYLGDAFNQRTKWLQKDLNMTKVELLSDLIQPLDEIAEYDIKKEVKVKSNNLAIRGFTYIYDNTFILQQLGEDIIHKSSMVAYMLSQKVTGTDGKQHSLWSLFSVENDQLVFNSILAGITDINKFIKDHKNTIIDINSKNQGDYSKDNSSVHSNQITYQVAILFRKWLPAMIADRLQEKRYNYKTGNYDEGFFRTGNAVIVKSFTNSYLNILSLIKQNENILLDKKDITKDELIAIRKIVGDLIQIITFTFLPLLVMPPPEDEEDYAWWLPDALQDWFYKSINLGIYKNKRQFDKSKSPVTMFVKYMSDHSNRIATDRLQFYNVFKYDEVISRMALVQTLKELGQAFYSLGELSFGSNKNKVITKGVNKGEYKALKEGRDIVPYWKQYDKLYKQTKKKVTDLQK